MLALVFPTEVIPHPDVRAHNLTNGKGRVLRFKAADLERVGAVS